MRMFIVVVASFMAFCISGIHGRAVCVCEWDPPGSVHTWGGVGGLPSRLGASSLPQSTLTQRLYKPHTPSQYIYRLLPVHQLGNLIYDLNANTAIF